jgi:peptidyl-prolyl cis-trans isomerase D
MLNFIRSHAASWVVKILFLMLILSFAAWGIGDIFRLQRQTGPVISVGDVKIRREAVSQQFDRVIRSMQPLFNNRLDRDQARQIGLLDRAVDQLIGEALLQQETQKLGIIASDNVVLHAIQTDPNFQGPDGKFDRSRFERILAGSELSEQGYVELLRRDLTAGQLIGAVSTGIAVPQILTETVYRHRNERRVGEAAVVPVDAKLDIPAPEEGVLKDWYEAHKDQFQAPEYRALTVALLSPDTVAKDIAITDEEIAAEYEARKDSLSRPERRDLVQVVTNDETTAKRVEERVHGGADLATAAQEAGAPAPVELGPVDVNSLPGSVGDAAFAASEGTITEPVQSPLGWHIVQVRKIEPGLTPRLDEVKEQLHHDLALHKAADQIAELANQFEDALAGGATMEEAAKKVGFQTRKIEAVDASGHDPKGAEVPGLQNSATVLNTAFATESGTESSLGELDNGGYFMVRVDGVTPAQPRPFDQVKDQVLAAWQKEERSRRAETNAKALAEKVTAGADFAPAAAVAGTSVKSTAPLLRSQAGTDAGLIPEATTKLFTLKQGETAVVPVENGYAVLRLKEIVPAVPAADPQGMKSVETELKRTLGNETAMSYESALRHNYPVDIDRDALQSF